MEGAGEFSCGGGGDNAMALAFALTRSMTAGAKAQDTMEKSISKESNYFKRLMSAPWE